MTIVLALLLAQAAAPAPDLARGEKIFSQSCAIGYCHGAKGAANRGPRLRGRHFERQYLIRVIRDGIANTAMPAFKATLNEADLNAVIAYVESLSDAADTSGHEVSSLPAVKPAAPVAEAHPGRSLFFDATKGTRCGSCHVVDNQGVAVGPALARAAGTSADILNAIQKGKANRVRMVTIRGEAPFPAIVVEQSSDTVRLYDLNSMTPVLRTLPARDVTIGPASDWLHGSLVRGYTAAELTMIASYLSSQ